jgi:flavin reductase (DIM6/NTAB) family NADH-FMN oxidoreductase RutF
MKGLCRASRPLDIPTADADTPSGGVTDIASAEASATLMIDILEYKAALGSFATGVTLATTAAGTELHGVTASAVTSVSLEPPLVLLSIQNGTRMHTALRLSDNFALNILTAEQRDVALYFADSTLPHGTAAFSRFAFHVGHTGAPLLDGALAHVDCRIVEAHVAGDHTLYIGHVVYVDSSSGSTPLIYFKGDLS